jgi:hypothetical protein
MEKTKVEVFFGFPGEGSEGLAPVFPADKQAVLREYRNCYHQEQGCRYRFAFHTIPVIMQSSDIYPVLPG